MPRNYVTLELEYSLIPWPNYFLTSPAHLVDFDVTMLTSGTYMTPVSYPI